MGGKEQRIQVLEQHIRLTNELIGKYEKQKLLSDDIKLKYTTEEEIDKYRAELAAFEAEYAKLTGGNTGTTSSVQQPVNQVTQSSGSRTKVFISYAHEDKEWLDRLQVHLKPLERSGVVERWDDSRIKPGMRWRDEIRKALATTKVALLLVSADFLASDFIDNKELPPLLEASANEGAVILPVILRPCRFRESILSEFQSFNPSSKPLSSLSKTKQDEQLVELTRVIEEALKR